MHHEVVQLHDNPASCLQEAAMTEEQKAFADERGGGNYGAGTRAMQERNYMARQQREKQRKTMFEEALDKFRAQDIENVSISLSANVLKNFVAKFFSTLTAAPQSSKIQYQAVAPRCFVVAIRSPFFGDSIEIHSGHQGSRRPSEEFQ